jgi:hypothetical protein
MVEDSGGTAEIHAACRINLIARCKFRVSFSRRITHKEVAQ